MFGIGTGELIIILIIVLLLFGSSRIPELGRGLGDGIRSFRDAMRGSNPEPVAAEDAATKARPRPSDASKNS